MGRGFTRPKMATFGCVGHFHVPLAVHHKTIWGLNYAKKAAKHYLPDLRPVRGIVLRLNRMQHTKMSNIYLLCHKNM